MIDANGRLLVTGGAGYLGSGLVTALLAQGREVVVLDDLTFGTVGLVGVLDHPNLRLVEADVRDVSAVRAAVRGVEAVFHLAAIANDPSGDLDTALTRSVNLESHGPLLEESRAAGARLFVHASSFSVYGVNVTANITEDDPLNCQREYSRCKAESEVLVRSFASSRFTTVNLRLATLCGWSPRMRFDLIANWLLAQAQVQRRIVVLGGEQQRPHIHIDDVRELMMQLLAVPSTAINGEVFNTGGENNSIRQLAEQARDVVEQDGRGAVELDFQPARDDERSYHVSSDKLEHVLGFRARRPVHQAMTEIAAAYRRGEWTNPQEPAYHNLQQLGRRLRGAALL